MWNEEAAIMMDTHFAIGDDGLLVVETTSGNVSVVGDDGDEVELLNPEGQAEATRDDNTLHIKARHWGHADLALRAPSRCALTVRSASGDITLEGMAGQVTVQTMSGEVTGRYLTGELRARTVSGDTVVQASQLHDVSIDTVSGNAVIETALAEEGTYEARTVSGDVTLRLSLGQRCTVAFASLSGHFKCKLPHETTHREWGKLEAHVQGGGPRASMRSTSGDLRIEASEQEASPVETAAPRNQGETRRFDTADEPFGLDEQPAPPEQAERPVAERRMEILRAIEAGSLSVGEGLAKLRDLD
jgi:DUF4097 and DUF4098 domain-containing protein YvlB